MTDHATPAVGEDVLVVLCTAPEADAGRLADLLVERRLAACVGLVGPIESRFHWEGRIDTAREIQLVAKTTAARFAELRDVLAEAHPYDVPEILALPVVAGLPAYVQWLTDSTRPSAGE